MTREEQLAAVREVLRGESFAVFAFAGAPGEAPYTSVMFFAETDDLQIVFATGAGSLKATYARDGTGACAQFDTRGVGLDNFAKFARVTLQGRLEKLVTAEATAAAHAVYLKKLPFARAFLRPGVLTYRLHPSRVVCARGFQERFELEFPAPAR
jgi:nitroimidazol reductase NimA-like FMN-containing flavoprotein (pyridoxamine 5'-phosphate oxidase superfamily)